MERKSEWFCGVNFFRSNFKVEWENGVWTKIRFLGSDFLFTCGNFTLIFTVFWFFGSDFFLNGFPNPFTALSRPSFLFELNFNFSTVVFFVHMRHFDIDFLFFFCFFYLIFLNGFLNSLIFHSRSSFFCLVNENSLNCTSGLALLCFLFRRHDFCYDHMTSQPLFVHSFMQFQLNCMCDVIFRF